MALFLVQHGKSLEKEKDPERGLSPEGITEVTRIAEVAAGYGVMLSHIRQLKLVIIVLGVIILLGVSSNAVSAVPGSQICDEGFEWLDQQEGAFVLSYTSRNRNLAQEFSNKFSDSLNEQFDKYSKLYGGPEDSYKKSTYLYDSLDGCIKGPSYTG